MGFPSFCLSTRGFPLITLMISLNTRTGVSESSLTRRLMEGQYSSTNRSYVTSLFSRSAVRNGAGRVMSSMERNLDVVMMRVGVFEIMSSMSLKCAGNASSARCCAASSIKPGSSPFRLVAPATPSSSSALQTLLYSFAKCRHSLGDMVRTNALAVRGASSSLLSARMSRHLRWLCRARPCTTAVFPAPARPSKNKIMSVSTACCSSALRYKGKDAVRSVPFLICSI
mmetsp:Transcript_113511/g.206528  ORF Transcript_113511/g.206528 Transcript_113511/m.206528 type:complete len:227 (+) Transcript_113511:376-1056(+)